MGYMPRIAYHEEMERVEAGTLEVLDLVREALGAALVALRDRDEDLARAVIEADGRIHEQLDKQHQDLLSLIARQQPVAGDLRLLTALLEATRHIERMGDQCANVAKLVPRLAGMPPLDEEMHGCVNEMAELTREEIRQAQAAFARRDVKLAEALVSRDQEVNERNKRCFALAVRAGGDQRAREAAMLTTMIARFLERIGDNAVDLGELTVFVVTGRRQEFSDASRPLPA
jgi:phosphate transport system protein